MNSANQAKEIHEQIVEFIDAGRSFALATILKADGSTPQEVGVKATIDHKGKIWGTVGGGRVEAKAQQCTIEACKLKQSVVFDIQLAGASSESCESLCGGSMRVLIDTNAAKNRTAYAQTAEAIAQHQNLAPVRSTQGVINMVRFGIELAVIPEQVINAIRQRMAPGTGLIKIEPLKIEAGDKVRVFDGPLAGLNGIVQEKSSENRTLILMELLGSSTKVEVNTLDLQRTA